MKNTEFTMLPCSTAGIHAVAAASLRVFSRHTHEQFGIGVVVQGAQKSHSGRGAVEATAGDVITVNPAEVHDGAPVDDAGRSWKMLYLDPALVAKFMHDASEGKRSEIEFSRPVLRNAETTKVFLNLFSNLTKPDTTLTHFANEQALLTLLAHVVRPRPVNQCAPTTAILRAKNLLDDDPLAEITLADLAQASNLSRFQMLRAFQKITGLTPHAYLIQARIHIARKLIARGTSLADAAINSGFADQSHMTRIFVRKYGMSPGTYARAMR